MTAEAFSAAKVEALLRLLDDDAPVVRKAVLAELQRCPDQGEALLREAAKGMDAGLSKRALLLLEELGWSDGVEAFLEFIRSLKYELETGWLLLDRTVSPTCDTAACHLFIDEMAQRCRELAIPPLPPREQCRVMNRVFFHEYGFRAAAKGSYAPANSFLHKVIESRSGLPITLSVLYLLVAGRIGFELEPIGLPGRFMVGCFEEETPFYVDVWSGGRFREMHELEAFLKNVPVEKSSSFLLPVTVAETLTRGCRNLVMQYRRGGDEERASLFRRFVAEFESALHREANA